jgi:ferredoxin--NADP+ reductase
MKADEVIAVARRGPAEVKFTKKEMENVARNLDLEALNEEITRVSARMKAVNQDPQVAKDFILSALPKAKEPVSESRFLFEFLSSPCRILGDESGQVCGLEVDDTELVPRNGDTKAQRLGTKRVLDVDTVIFCIGDRVDETFGLPVQWNEYVKNPAPKFPVDSCSYEAYDPDVDKPIEGVFFAGWSREASSGLVGVARKDGGCGANASSGLVGVARKDGGCGANALLQYLQTKSPLADTEKIIEELDGVLEKNFSSVVSKEDVQRLEAVEKAKAQELGLEEYKMKTNEEMLAAIIGE